MTRSNLAAYRSLFKTIQDELSLFGKPCPCILATILATSYDLIQLVVIGQDVQYGVINVSPTDCPIRYVIARVLVLRAGFDF